MAANPMQKKVRNSFLLGMIVTLVICILIAVMVYFLFFSKDAKAKSDRGEEVVAYVLKQNVQSGQTITSDLLKEITVYSNMIPANYISSSQLNMMKLQDKEGNVLYTNSEGQMYMEIKDGNKLYKTITNKNDQVVVEIDDVGYYRTVKAGGEKEYIEFKNVPVIAKVNMYKNSILTIDTVSKSDQIITDDVRVVEYNMLTLPMDILVGDYIDIRLTFPNGQDFIVVPKKQIKAIRGNTITFNMAEEEILMVSSAIVESYIMPASNIYVARYVEPGLQQKAYNTYTPTAEVSKLIESDSNIVAKAKARLQERFNIDIRNTDMNTSRVQYSGEELENIEAGIQKQIQDAKDAREEYLQALETTTVNTNE